MFRHVEDVHACPGSGAGIGEDVEFAATGNGLLQVALEFFKQLGRRAMAITGMSCPPGPAGRA